MPGEEIHIYALLKLRWRVFIVLDERVSVGDLLCDEPVE
jgi:hypothetical protein